MHVMVVKALNQKILQALIARCVQTVFDFQSLKTLIWFGKSIILIIVPNNQRKRRARNVQEVIAEQYWARVMHFRVQNAGKKFVSLIDLLKTIIAPRHLEKLEQTPCNSKYLQALRHQNHLRLVHRLPLKPTKL
jgi:hypothetical protein